MDPSSRTEWFINTKNLLCNNITPISWIPKYKAILVPCIKWHGIFTGPIHTPPYTLNHHRLGMSLGGWNTCLIHPKFWVLSQHCVHQSWWYTPVIPALGRYKQEDQEFKVILCYTENLRLAWETWDLILKINNHLYIIYITWYNIKQYM